MGQNRNHSSSHTVGVSDDRDAVMARWLQSAGLQHLAAPLSAAAVDHQLLPTLLMQVPSTFSMRQFLLCPVAFLLVRWRGNDWIHSSFIPAVANNWPGTDQTQDSLAARLELNLRHCGYRLGFPSGSLKISRNNP